MNPISSQENLRHLSFVYRTMCFICIAMWGIFSLRIDYDLDLAIEQLDYLEDTISDITYLIDGGIVPQLPTIQQTKFNTEIRSRSTEVPFLNDFALSIVKFKGSGTGGILDYISVLNHRNELISLGVFELDYPFQQDLNGNRFIVSGPPALTTRIGLGCQRNGDWSSTTYSYYGSVNSPVDWYAPPRSLNDVSEFVNDFQTSCILSLPVGLSDYYYLINSETRFTPRINDGVGVLRLADDAVIELRANSRPIDDVVRFVPPLVLVPFRGELKSLFESQNVEANGIRFGFMQNIGVSEQIFIPTLSVDIVINRMEKLVEEHGLPQNWNNSDFLSEFQPLLDTTEGYQDLPFDSVRKILTSWKEGKN